MRNTRRRKKKNSGQRALVVETFYKGKRMSYDTGKVDDAVLALLYLNMFEDNANTRAWKSLNWNSMNRLHEKGYIANPKSKSKSVAVTSEGKKAAEETFSRLFGAQNQPQQ
jgi:hypothetical protein